MSANEVKVNGTDGHGMGAEPPESSSGSEPTMTIETAPKKRRGRPRKNGGVDAAADLSRAFEGAPEAFAVVDPRQLALLAGDSAPSTIDASTLAVHFGMLHGEWSRRASALEVEGERLRVEAERCIVFRSRELLYVRSDEMLVRALMLRGCVRDLCASLGGLGVR